MSDPQAARETPEPLKPCVFVPANEPWTCNVHLGVRTSLDEPLCDIARPAEPFNDAYLDNIRQGIAEGRSPAGRYVIRRLLATIDALRAVTPDPAEPCPDCGCPRETPMHQMGCRVTYATLDPAERATRQEAADVCGWDTRRGDGPIGGPCLLPPMHDGPHDPEAGGLLLFVADQASTK